MDPKWLEWAKRLQALAQSGLNYSENPFEIERYEEIREIAAEIYAAHASVKPERVVDLFASQTGHATPKVDVRGVVFRDDAILLDREGRIRAALSGEADWDGPEARALIDALLAEGGGAAPSTT